MFIIYEKNFFEDIKQMQATIGINELLKSVTTCPINFVTTCPAVMTASFGILTNVVINSYARPGFESLCFVG